jgi:hypothetical protein
VYLAERWYTPETGSRRLSNIVRVTNSDIRRGVPPPAQPRGGRALLQSQPPRP